MRQKDFHEKAVCLVKAIHKYEAELLQLLKMIEERKLFLEWGFSSLFAYAVDGLKLSESRAFNFINVARKTREVPELQEEINQGHLSISKARKIVPVLTKENQKEWLLKAHQLSQRLLEREVAKASPRTKKILFKRQSDKF